MYCCYSFVLSWVDKVTTGAQSFVSVIANFIVPVAEEVTQSAEEVRMRLISQLIKGISRVLQRLLKYFNDTVISTFFVLLAAGGFSVIFTLELNDSESIKFTFG